MSYLNQGSKMEKCYMSAVLGRETRTKKTNYSIITLICILGFQIHF